MSLIEGVGDEVVQFMVVLLVVVIASLAWWSTNARPDRYRTVLVMRSRPHHPVTVSILTSECIKYITHSTKNMKIHEVVIEVKMKAHDCSSCKK